jgi:hypothetical protein
MLVLCLFSYLCLFEHILDIVDYLALEYHYYIDFALSICWNLHRTFIALFGLNLSSSTLELSKLHYIIEELDLESLIELELSKLHYIIKDLDLESLIELLSLNG